MSNEDMRQLTFNTVENYGKKEAKTARDLARKALGREKQSPFTSRIISTDPPCKFIIIYPIYNGKSYPVTMSELTTRQ